MSAAAEKLLCDSTSCDLLTLSPTVAVWQNSECRYKEAEQTVERQRQNTGTLCHSHLQIITEKPRGTVMYFTYMLMGESHLCFVFNVLSNEKYFSLWLFITAVKSRFRVKQSPFDSIVCICRETAGSNYSFNWLQLIGSNKGITFSWLNIACLITSHTRQMRETPDLAILCSLYFSY